MLYGQVVPPVIEESRLSFNIANNNEIRLADKEIKIIKQARFVTTPPTWRDYIFISYQKPKVPSLAILPHNKVALCGNLQSLQAGNKALSKLTKILKLHYVISTETTSG